MMRKLSGLLSLLAAIAVCAPALGQEPALSSADSAAASPSSARAGQQLPALLEALDNDDYHVRRDALEGLVGLAEDPAQVGAVAEQLHRMLLDPATSFEVRAAITPLAAQLPTPAIEPDIPYSAAKLDELVAQLDSASYTQRIGAEAQLRWLSTSNQWAREVADHLKRLLSGEGMTEVRAKRIDTLWQMARGTWLATGSQDSPPQVTDEQIATWAAAMVSPGSVTAADAARRDLMDLLAFDSLVPQVRAVLEAQPVPGPDRPEAAARLAEMKEWTQPALVAEIWKDYQTVTLQWLLVDVPQQPEGAPRATHFDRIDDETAHCASGNSLAPGVYQVGVAIPPTRVDHAMKQGIAFHLVNLPTPRRRWMFEHEYAHVPEYERLTQLSRRTIDWLLKRNEALSEREVMMLTQLDPGLASEFIGPYLAAVDDVPHPAAAEFRIAGATSRHAMLCYVAATFGNQQAAQGIREAIAKKRFVPVSPEAPYELPWIAVLAIIQRQPWEGSDSLLAELVERTDLLRLVPDGAPVDAAVDAPELGATAAGLLLLKHRLSPADFGLAPCHEAAIEPLELPLYRFESPARRKDVVQWWRNYERGVATRPVR